MVQHRGKGTGKKRRSTESISDAASACCWSVLWWWSWVSATGSEYGIASCDSGGIFRTGHMAAGGDWLRVAEVIGHLGEDLGDGSRYWLDQKYGFSDGLSVDIQTKRK